METLKVFIGSPSDCENDRKRVISIIKKANIFFIEASHIELEPQTWNLGGLMGSGNPQEIINRETL